MSLGIGIIGLPNVGKSTLFNALTRKAVAAENFPFCTIDPSVGVVAVPDSRLIKLSELSKSERTIPAAVEFVDIAGLVKGAAQGEGLGNQFLAHIREVDAIAHVVRIFDDPNIAHVHGEHISPLDDIDVINTELVLADLQTVQKRLTGIEKDAKRGDKEAVAERELLEKLQAGLQEGKTLRYVVRERISEWEEKVIHQLHLLTAKPVLYVLNKRAGGHSLDELNDERWQNLLAFLHTHGAHWVIVDAAIEGELGEVHPDDRDTFRQELGALDDGINTLIATGFDLLNLIVFFTTGPDETRAWTIKGGSTAPGAGAAIHSDFRDKFIRAEVISYTKLMEAGGFAAARERGLVRTEGREYVVQDGDVIEFKI